MSDEGVVKLIDFGLARDVFEESEDGMMRAYCGTENYMVPQMHMKEPFNAFKADLFSLGVVIFGMHCARFPWTRATSKDFHFKHFFKQTQDEFWLVHERKQNRLFPDQMKDFLSKVWR